MNLFRDFKEGMEAFGETIAVIINTLLLSMVYAFGVGMTSIIAKIFGKKFLDMGMMKEKGSYWENSDSERKRIEDYYRRF